MSQEYSINTLHKGDDDDDDDNNNNNNSRAMDQAVLCRPLTAEERIQPQANLCGNGSVQNDIGTGFSPNTSIFLC